ncbi:lipid-A-disaccharide synthase [Candidatus Photodesmus blepharus]|uniref:Lipid-A-disaccharide synthase n=1 Tax=Candidatus Photodesmus blepharonis TaxID=1179155 RepID=A0A084CNY7_9GAMM|nr:lipid-A-disaccharide synthase [Candidatus Photodesmus blepharus]KEY91516.1 lipid-A-disaccharide synthase [Candidatus Photodesmus blepharus]
MEGLLNIGIVVGELSGDNLGEGFIKAVKQKYPGTKFVGIGGPRMISQGCKSLYDVEELASIGLFEVIGHLPRLLKIKAELVKYFIQNPPDIFIGIDAPDFNLRLELALKKVGIKTVHYVSPSIWAWRSKRILKIAAATDLVLTILPFEKKIYDQHRIACKFIGHPLADKIPMKSDQFQAQKKLCLNSNKRWLAVMPGSREREVELIAQPFIEACCKIKRKYPDIGFIVAAVNQKRRKQFERIWQATRPELQFLIFENAAYDVIVASDGVLLTSGTVALECMLFKRPMVVGYKMSRITGWLMKKLAITKFVSLPNILAGEELVKEYILDRCSSEFLFSALNCMLRGNHHILIERFNDMHKLLQQGADKKAVQAVFSLINQ